MTTCTIILWDIDASSGRNWKKINYKVIVNVFRSSTHGVGIENITNKVCKSVCSNVKCTVKVEPA